MYYPGWGPFPLPSSETPWAGQRIPSTTIFEFSSRWVWCEVLDSGGSTDAAKPSFARLLQR